MTTIPVRNPDIVSNELHRLNTVDGMPWRKIANLDDYRGIPAGTLAAIAKGYPIPKKWARRLGVPVYVPTEACPACGQVHKIDGVCIARSRVTVTVTEVSAEEYARIDKPVTITIKRARPASRPRASINLSDPQSAARTIRRKMDAETLALLVDLLKEAA